jgi:hypothetical protein
MSVVITKVVMYNEWLAFLKSANKWWRFRVFSTLVALARVDIPKRFCRNICTCHPIGTVRSHSETQDEPSWRRAFHARNPNDLVWNHPLLFKECFEESVGQPNADVISDADIDKTTLRCYLARTLQCTDQVHLRAWPLSCPLQLRTQSSLVQIGSAKRYKRKEQGDRRVASTNPQNPQLAMWTTSQRIQFKLYREGVSSNLSEERLKSFERFGLRMGTEKRQWRLWGYFEPFANTIIKMNFRDI